MLQQAWVWGLAKTFFGVPSHSHAAIQQIVLLSADACGIQRLISDFYALGCTFSSSLERIESKSFLSCSIVFFIHPELQLGWRAR
jgi:hypothetical protein